MEDVEEDEPEAAPSGDLGETCPRLGLSRDELVVVRMILTLLELESPLLDFRTFSERRLGETLMDI